MDIAGTSDAIVESYKKERLVPLVDGALDSLILCVIDKSLSLTPSPDATPIVLMSGYCGGPGVVRRNALELARLGRSVLALGVPPRSKIFSSNKNFPPGTTLLTKVHASALLRTLDEAEKIFGQKTFDVLGYSYGAVVVLTAALVEPHRFRKILLLNPAGFGGSISYVRRALSVSVRFLKHEHQVRREAASNQEKKNLHQEFFSASNAVGRQGGWPYTLQTVHAVSLANITALTASVLKKGIPIAVLAGEDDPLFPPAEIKKNFAGLKVNIFSAPGAHSNAGFNPIYMARRYIEIFNLMG